MGSGEQCRFVGGAIPAYLVGSPKSGPHGQDPCRFTRNGTCRIGLTGPLMPAIPPVVQRESKGA